MIKSYDEASHNHEIMSSVRKLTLHSRSGMNYELDQFAEISKIRNVNAKFILALEDSIMIAWALLSNEKSDFFHFTDGSSRMSEPGALFEVYVQPDYRRSGIGSDLLKIGRRLAGPNGIYICPWDNNSRSFYRKTRICNDKIIA